VELFQIVRRLENLDIAAPARDAQHQQEPAIGLVKGDGKGVIILDLDHIWGAGAFVAGTQPGRRARGQLGVHHDVFIGEPDVLGGYRRPVGPLDPLAQVEGELGLGCIHLEGIADVARDLFAQDTRGVDQGLVAHHENVRIPVGGGGQGADGPSVATDLEGELGGRHRVRDLGLERQALLDRRQLARGNQLGEHGGFAELAGCHLFLHDDGLFDHFFHGLFDDDGLFHDLFHRDLLFHHHGLQDLLFHRHLLFHHHRDWLLTHFWCGLGAARRYRPHRGHGGEPQKIAPPQMLCDCHLELLSHIMERPRPSALWAYPTVFAANRSCGPRWPPFPPPSLISGALVGIAPRWTVPWIA